MRQRSEARLWAVCTVLVCFGVSLGCGTPDAPPVQLYPGHLAYVSADANAVISVNNLAKRSKTIVSSKAYARFQAFVQSLDDASEVQGLVNKPEEALNRFDDLFEGRLTFVSYPNPKNIDDDAFVLLVDGDAKELVQALEQLDLPDGQVSKGSFSEVGGGIARYTSPHRDAQSEDDLFVSQRGPIGMVGSTSAVLGHVTAVVAGPPKGLLAEQPAFASVQKKLRQDADVFIWLRDWTSEEDVGWDSLLSKKPKGASIPKAAAATLMLEDGIDAELMVEFQDSDFGDVESRAVFSAMRSTGQTQDIVPMLPKGTLAYLGINMNLLELAKSMDSGGIAQDEQFKKMFQEFVGAFQGEFALAVTSATGDGEDSLMLGYPVPGVVLVARMSDTNKQGMVQKMLDLYLESQSVAAGGQFLVQRREDSTLGPKMVLYTTMDPSIEVGYTFHKDCLVLGTRAGLADIVNAGDGAQGMASQAGSETIKNSLTTPSHFSLFLDLASLYQFVRTNHSELFGPLSEFAEGDAKNDPLVDVFSVFHHAGGNLSFQSDHMYLRLYITASDLP